MQPKFVSGNAYTESGDRRGWFIGYFITPNDDLRSTNDIEVKWTVHKAGDQRKEWATNQEATTLSLLIRGRFRLQLLDEEIVLSSEGDYVLWSAGLPHCWFAELDSTVLTVRYPSKPNDSVDVPIQEDEENTLQQ